MLSWLTCELLSKSLILSILKKQQSASQFTCKAPNRHRFTGSAGHSCSLLMVVCSLSAAGHSCTLWKLPGLSQNWSVLWLAEHNCILSVQVVQSECCHMFVSLELHKSLSAGHSWLSVSHILHIACIGHLDTKCTLGKTRQLFQITQRLGAAFLRLITAACDM